MFHGQGQMTGNAALIHPLICKTQAISVCGTQDSKMHPVNNFLLTLCLFLLTGTHTFEPFLMKISATYYGTV